MIYRGGKIISGIYRCRLVKCDEPGCVTMETLDAKKYKKSNWYAFKYERSISNHYVVIYSPTLNDYWDMEADNKLLKNSFEIIGKKSLTIKQAKKIFKNFDVVI